MARSADRGDSLGSVPDRAIGKRSTLSSALRQWRTVELPVLTVLGAGIFALGMIGFKDLSHSKDSFYDSIHQTIQLFVLESSIPEGVAVPVTLDIARFLAPLIAGYAAVRAFVSLFHAQLGMLLVRFRRDHVVIAGLGDKGFKLARVLRDDKRRVAVVESNWTHKSIAGARERGIPVVVGDARDVEVLQLAGTGRARSVVAVTGDDGTNVDVAFTAAAIAGRSSRNPVIPFILRLFRPSPARDLTAFVHLDDLALWRMLRVKGLLEGAQIGIRAEFFNISEAAAPVLLAMHSPFGTASVRKRPPRIGVVGATGIGESLLIHACRKWNEDSSDLGRMEVTVFGQDARTQCRRLADRHPTLELICSVEAQDLDPTAPEMTDWASTSVADMDALYVCLQDETDGLAVSLALHEATAGKTRIVFVVRQEDIGAGTVVEHRGLKNLSVFGMLTRTLTPQLLAETTNEQLAKATHEHYLAAEREWGVTPEANDSMVSWNELPESLRQSNRSFADGIAEKMDAIDCAIVPSPLADPRHPSYHLGGAEVKELAPMEHDRWERFLRQDGWVFHEGPKDPERKLHPSLKPWEKLTEAEKDKDRSAVRAIPEILARAGFDIVPVRKPEGDAPGRTRSRTRG